MNYIEKVTLGLALFALPIIGNAQEKIKTIEKGNVLLSPSITMGTSNYGVALDPVNFIPPVGFNFEYASSDYFSFGLEAEYAVRRYQDFLFTTESSSYTYQYKSLNFRGSFHYLDLLKDLVSDNLVGFYQLKLDMYLGASTGILVTNTTEKWNDGLVTEDHERKTFNSNLRFGYFAGFRYYLSDNFGVFAETGRNTFGWAKFGVTLKF